MGEKTKLTPTVIVLAGLTLPILAAVDPDGDYFTNSGRHFISVKNGAAAERTVTIATQTECTLGTKHDVPIVLAVGAEKLIGPFPKDRFNDEDGYVQISYSDAGADVTIAVMELP